MTKFFTNLDDAKPYVRRLSETWLPAYVPRCGEQIRFCLIGRKTFDLEVMAVTYDEFGEPAVELHIGRSAPGMTIREWIDWFKEHSRG